jgi:hypothetical protein
MGGLHSKGLCHKRGAHISNERVQRGDPVASAPISYHATRYSYRRRREIAFGNILPRNGTEASEWATQRHRRLCLPLPAQDSRYPATYCGNMIERIIPAQLMSLRTPLLKSVLLLLFSHTTALEIIFERAAFACARKESNEKVIRLNGSPGGHHQHRSPTKEASRRIGRHFSLHIDHSFKRIVWSSWCYSPTLIPPSDIN